MMHFERIKLDDHFQRSTVIPVQVNPITECSIKRFFVIKEKVNKIEEEKNISDNLFLNISYCKKLFTSGHFKSYNVLISRPNYHLLVRRLPNNDYIFATFKIKVDILKQLTEIKVKIP